MQGAHGPSWPPPLPAPRLTAQSPRRNGYSLAEKWVDGKAPFEVIWEHMDAGYLTVDNRVPQGPLRYLPNPDGRMVLHTDWPSDHLGRRHKPTRARSGSTR